MIWSRRAGISAVGGGADDVDGIAETFWDDAGVHAVNGIMERGWLTIMPEISQ